MRRKSTPTLVEEPENGAGPADAALIARICWHYFKEGQTQDAIAQHLKITRKRVNQLLGEARESGFVQISITGPLGPASELEARLTAKFKLKRVVVVPTPMQSDVRALVGAAAGHYISQNLKAGAALGITWGGTINMAAQNLRRRSGQDNKVVLLCGGLADSTSINPYDNAAMTARALDATCSYITAPMFTATEKLRDDLVSSEPVRSVLAMVPKLDMALLSAIDLSRHSKALEYGVISRAAWESLRRAGAVGDICGHYLSADGKPIAHELCQRVINPSLKDLRAIPELVLAAGGKEKAPIVAAGIRAGLCHVLITDESAGACLLDSD
jgi:DNA-binding transcriptional regulator LsrR (DeoR family)